MTFQVMGLLHLSVLQRCQEETGECCCAPFPKLQRGEAGGMDVQNRWKGKGLTSGGVGVSEPQ